MPESMPESTSESTSIPSFDFPYCGRK
jgi:hypothetical protein